MSNNDIHIESENVTPIHEINLVLTSVKVECEPIKIRAAWSPMILDDLRYFEAIDPNDETDFILAFKIKQRIKHQKRKDRRAYIEEIESWVGHKIRRTKKV